MDNEYWKQRYLKYKSKNESLIAQIGGTNDEKKYLKILNNIKEELKSKGYVFWFDVNGKVLAQGLTTQSAKTLMIKKINEDKNKWNNAIVTELVVEFDKKNIMDEESGGLSITVDLNRIKFNQDKLSIQMKNKTNSLFAMCYKYDELSKFKLRDLKKISLFVSNETLKKFKSKTYSYSDIVEYF